MVLYRVEHHESCSGPFQSEFYPKDIDDLVGLCPDQWGNYIPCYDPVSDHHYDYKKDMRRWACHNECDIQMMDADEGEALSYAGWIVRVYEVPDSCVFICQSKKQVVFDFACAKRKRTLCLSSFLLGKEVEYVE